MVTALVSTGNNRLLYLGTYGVGHGIYTDSTTHEYTRAFMNSGIWPRINIEDNPVSSWASDRRETIRELRKLGNNMKKHAKNAKIASAVGCGTASLAGAGAAICYFIAPFTAGLSLVPASAFTGVVIAGGFTSVGASVTNIVIEKFHMSDVQKALDKDKSSLNILKKAIKKAEKITIEKGFERTVTVGKGIPSSLKFVSYVTRKLNVSEKAAASLLKLGKTARFAGHTVALIALPLDIIFFVSDVTDLVNGNVSVAAENVLQLAEELETELDLIMFDA